MLVNDDEIGCPECGSTLAWFLDEQEEVNVFCDICSYKGFIIRHTNENKPVLHRDLVDVTYNRLVVVEKYKRNCKGAFQWLCRCSCGRLVVVREDNLLRGACSACNKCGGKYSIPTYYKNIKFRSSWEAKYAEYLDENNIKWKYESESFPVKYKYNGEEKEKIYIPDFYLPDDNKYVEIKGQWIGSSKKKFRLFKEQYPNIKIELLRRKDLKKLGLLE